MRKLKLIRSKQVAAKPIEILSFDQAKDFGSEDIYEFSNDPIEILFYKKDDDFPLPWDAAFQIKGAEMTLSGNAGASGFGSCTVTLPKRDADKCFSVEMSCFNEDDYEALRNYLTAKNVKFK